MRAMGVGIFLLLVLVYFLVRFVQTRKQPPLVIATVALAFLLHAWPFSFSLRVTHFALAGMIALHCFYGAYKRRDVSVLFYGLVLCYFCYLYSNRLF